MEIFSDQLVDRKGRKLDKFKAKQFLLNFMREWRVFHSYLSSFSMDKLYELLSIYQKNEDRDENSEKINN